MEQDCTVSWEKKYEARRDDCMPRGKTVCTGGDKEAAIAKPREKGPPGESQRPHTLVLDFQIPAQGADSPVCSN